MSKRKKSMIGKAIEYEVVLPNDPSRKGKGVIRDRFMRSDGSPKYLVEEVNGKVTVVSIYDLVRIITVVVLLAIGFFLFK